mmetsp:Transcript_21366/g.26294  ORF Transcript_21366/g.26294 Transcript_21366/m.26294 type:complete len:113 (+) Transcript_21366:3-341(+)
MIEDILTHSYVRIEVPEEYPFVALIAGLICVECILVGFLGPGRIRGQIFNKQFMEENFGKMIMEDPVLKQSDTRNLKSGYPDMGNGVYADKLSYKDWITWNKMSRAHSNFLD